MFRDEIEGYAPRMCDMGGEPRIEKISVRPARQPFQRQDRLQMRRSKLPEGDRAFIFEYCRSRNIEDDFPYLLHRAEDRYLSHKRLLMAKAAARDAPEGGAIPPVDRFLLDHWIDERYQPRLF